MDRKYVLFGAGRRAERMMRSIGAMFDISYIIDSDKSKWGNEITIHGKPYNVFPPDVLKEESLDVVEVIIGSDSVHEMVSQLENIALPFSKCLFLRAVKLKGVVEAQFSTNLVSFVDFDSKMITLSHNYNAIDANVLIFKIPNAPCAIKLDKVLINRKERYDYSAILRTNGEWDGRDIIHFSHYNPTVYIDEHDGIETVSLVFHYIETDYKKAFEFISGFTKSLSDFSNNKNPEFVPDEQLEPIEFRENDVKPIAFYLPQFHQSPLNDHWWEKGFTEWTNVTKTYPLFEGHYQPHLPIDMGFYDLNNNDVHKRQIELARKYGIYGFCYYYYHFEGAKLFDMPLNRHFQNKEMDFPFCIMWDIEAWSKRWVGDYNTSLLRIGQDKEFFLNVIKHIFCYLKDPRYIRVNGRPLIKIHRFHNLMNMDVLLKTWREYCLKEGLGEIYIVTTRVKNNDPITTEFDQINDFISIIRNEEGYDITHTLKSYASILQSKIFDYCYYINTESSNIHRKNGVFKTAIMNFDNSARYHDRATILHGTSPALYKQCVRSIIDYTQATHTASPEKYMFIFAWNEWAEAAHLEPDRKYGYAWLKATREAVEESRRYGATYG